MPRTPISRRRVLASLGVAPVASALTQASVADGTPQRAATDAPLVEHVLTATLRVRLAAPADATVGGAVIEGGEAEGPIGGAILPGSLEWTRDPVRGVLQLASRFDVQATAGLRIHVADRASVERPSEGTWEAPFATLPELTVVDGSPEACRQSVYLGRMDASRIHSGELRLTVHRVL